VIGWFHKNNPANVILLLLFAIVVKAPLFLHPQLAITSPSDGVLYTTLVNWVNRAGTSASFIFSLVAFLLNFSQALQLNRFFIQHKMMGRSTDFPAMAYLMVSSFFPAWTYLSAALFITTLVLILFSYLFRLYQKSEVKTFLFNVGLLIGVSSFVFKPAVFLMVWMLISVLILRPIRLNEFLLALLGLLTPFYFYGVILFLNDGWRWNYFTQFVKFTIPKLHSSAWDAGALSLLLVPFLMGGYYVQENLRKMLIQVRKGWSLLVLLLIAALAIPFFCLGDAYSAWFLILIPLSAFHACTYLYSSLRIIPILLFWVTFVFVLANQFGGTLWIH
jgi:hypothetical protein